MDSLSSELKCVRHERPNRLRQQLYRRAVLIALLGNVLLAAGKGAVAWISESSAVISDAANSLSDVLYSLLLAAGLYVAQQPADEGHPQGHGRFEPLVSVLISLAMAGAGVAAITEGVRRFRTGAVAIVSPWPTVVLLASAAVKVLMYVLVRDVGLKAASPAIRASARDNLGDVLASLAALVGVAGSRFVHPLLDPAAGVLVALWIFRSAWEILCENLGYLTGRGASPEVTAEVFEAACSVPGVLGVHQVIADHVGPKLRVDMHIDVDGEITLREAHLIADQVEGEVGALSRVGLVFVHVEPVDQDSLRET
ncbi:MAG: cation diffusion facilitator family transporter [Anaerolineae bacterium]